ncbi:hypothetical protein KUTeg_015592 [Tegillarca granosa]|uniref:Fibrinogen C-terminal domain-containing protein n=1 Tax=Tegillarca granosa TaxID=220873 RepID=A0ABQ9EQK5_TEGGR|nr:hypothetical protein KUTeg_015592 [Tegillarca granosa]
MYVCMNQILQELTSQRPYDLSVKLVDFHEITKYANYSTFQISGDKYTLTVGGYSGDAGDSLNYHNGFRFYTKDDPDPYGCVNQGNSEGAWWYNGCFASNLNGVYGSGKGMSWSEFHGTHTSLKSSLMMIRRAINTTY